MSSSLFREARDNPSQKKKPLPEEKLLIRITRDKARASASAALLRELGEPPSDEAIERVLDLMIERLRRDGTLQRALDEYLRMKIEEERSHFKASCDGSLGPK